MKYEQMLKLVNDKHHVLQYLCNLKQFKVFKQQEEIPIDKLEEMYQYLSLKYNISIHGVYFCQKREDSFWYASLFQSEVGVIGRAAHDKTLQGLMLKLVYMEVVAIKESGLVNQRLGEPTRHGELVERLGRAFTGEFDR